MTLGSLFAGIGGFDLAAKWAGIDVLYQVENDPFCNKVLAKHFPEVKRFGDIKHVSTGDIPHTDIITGGFPCQPYSVAGRKRGNQDDRALWPEMLRNIANKQPTWVIGENVPGIINMELENICADLEKKNYEVQPIIIPACSIGALHKRDRVWIVAHTRCEYEKGVRQLLQNEYQASKETSNYFIGTNKVLPDTNLSRRKKLYIADITKAERLVAWQDVKRWDIWDAEPELGRVADGVSRRVDRLRGLGNAIVPQVAYILLTTIKDISANKAE